MSAKLRRWFIKSEAVGGAVPELLVDQKRGAGQFRPTFRAPL